MRGLGGSMLIVALAAAALFAGEPRTPDQERATFRLADSDLVVDLVAAEPEVVSPVAIAWDESATLYVAEMTDYPVGPPSGRIRRLSDPDPVTGRYRSVTVFARDLPFPTGVLPHDGGVLVTSAPDIVFLRDDNGDGVAETRRVVLTGFAEGNQQLRVNALHRGIDNAIYGANGRSGGTLRRPEDPPDRAVSIDRSDFRIDPRTFLVEPVTGFSQFGLGHDDWGDRFPSWNTVPVRHVVLERTLLSRNPFLAAATNGVAEILPLGDVAVFPISATPRTFNRESFRAFNASCGTTIYRGDALGTAYAGDVFVGEPLTNLVHRRNLKPQGVTYQATRGEEGREFLAATDPWFHPVHFATGPDGCFYIVDFYREWVEHPDFVPAEMRGKVDWRRGAEHGRIWRVRRGGSPAPPPVRLDQATTLELVPALAHPNGWVRDTAQRLLVGRSADAPAEALRTMARRGPTPQARVQALWTLEGAGLLDTGTLLEVSRDDHPRVREHALKLAGLAPDRVTAMAGEILRHSEDRDARVRFQAAIGLAGRIDPEAITALAKILARDADDPWVGHAVLAGLSESVLPLIDALTQGHQGTWLDADDDARLGFLQRLGAMAGLQTRTVPAIDRLASRLLPGAEGRLAPGRLALLAGLVEALPDESGSPSGNSPGLARALDAALRSLDDPSTSPMSRVLALRLLTRGRPEALTERLSALASSATEPRLQRAAIEAVGILGDAKAASSIVADWARLPTAVRRELLAGLVRSPRLTTILADAIEDGTIAPSELDADLRVALGHIPDASLRARLSELLGETNSDRPAVVKEYVEAIVRDGLTGEPRRGAELFARHCSTCHRHRGEGHDVGPDLSGVASRPVDALADDILDPSREVSPDFRAFLAADHSGRVLTGLLLAESPTGVTLRGPGGQETHVARSDLEAFQATGKSLMPEGFEAQFDPAGLADLIAYLKDDSIEPGTPPEPSQRIP